MFKTKTNNEKVIAFKYRELYTTLICRSFLQSQWTSTCSRSANGTAIKSSRMQTYDLTLNMLSHTSSKKENFAKLNQLSNTSLTGSSWIFKVGIMAPSPMPHSFLFHIFPQSPCNDFKVTSRVVYNAPA